MSGFQEVAAAIGIAELALRSISRIYELVRGIKDAPESVARLTVELYELNSCLTELAQSSEVGSPTHAVVARLELPAIVDRCGLACANFEASLHKWTQGGRETLVSRLRVRFNKSQIETVVQIISSTKETIILALSIASFRLQNDMATTILNDRDAVVVSGKMPDNVSQINASGQVRGQLVHSTTDVASLSNAKQSISSTTIGTIIPHVPNEPLNREARTKLSGTPLSDSRNEAYDMEVQIIEKNEVTDSEGTKIGAPASLSIRRQHLEDNRVTSSKNTCIGRF